MGNESMNSAAGITQVSKEIGVELVAEIVSRLADQVEATLGVISR